MLKAASCSNKWNAGLPRGADAPNRSVRVDIRTAGPDDDGRGVSNQVARRAHFARSHDANVDR